MAQATPSRKSRRVIPLPIVLPLAWAPTVRAASWRARLSQDYARDARPGKWGARSGRPEPALAGFGQAATPALGFIPDFLDEALVALDAELDDDIHQQVEQALDVVPGELAPA